MYYYCEVVYTTPLSCFRVNINIKNKIVIIILFVFKLKYVYNEPSRIIYYFLFPSIKTLK